jgi:hypothetical protein
LNPRSGCPDSGFQDRWPYVTTSNPANDLGQLQDAVVPTMVPSPAESGPNDAATREHAHAISADLQLVIGAWANLSPEVRAAIVTLVRAASAGSAGRGADA